jgi:hypothetical protein
LREWNQGVGASPIVKFHMLLALIRVPIHVATTSFFAVSHKQLPDQQKFVFLISLSRAWNPGMSGRAVASERHQLLMRATQA